MKSRLRALVTMVILAAAPAATAQVSFSIRIGEPPPPRAFRVPPRPGPDYVWVEGYQYPEHGHYKWHDGYWTRPPYPRAYWVEILKRTEAHSLVNVHMDMKNGESERRTEY